MGLAQRYQIRGRVGRSGRKAYAYFTFRRDKTLTDIGDSDVGKYCNFGCGTVTCNYDGKDKFRRCV